MSCIGFASCRSLISWIIFWLTLWILFYWICITFSLLNISTIHTATILRHSSCAIQSSLLWWMYYVPCRNIINNLFYSHKIKTIKIILWDSMVLCIPLTESFLLRPDMQHNTSYVVTVEIVPFTDHHCQIADLVWHSLTSAKTITRLSILEIKISETPDILLNYLAIISATSDIGPFYFVLYFDSDAHYHRLWDCCCWSNFFVCSV